MVLIYSFYLCEREANPHVCLYSTEALHIAATEACIFATNNMDIKPCRFEDLYSYKEDCVEEQSRRIAVCDTVYASKLWFPIFPMY